MRLSEQDHARVSAAVAQAERGTAGEIVTIVAARSDKYHDVGLHWAVLAMLAILAALAIWPQLADLALDDPWGEAPAPRTLLTIALVAGALTFLLARLLFAWWPLRLALTPGATKSRRVRARALDHFRVGAEHRTTAGTGVLLYLSVAEHRAEIIADAAIHAAVPAERWGDIMADLVAEVRAGRAGDGLAEAVTAIGAILGEHFPRSENDVNELPDRVVEL
jgi:putative membrane protein